LSVTVRVAVRLVFAVGVNVTLMLQLPFAANVLGDRGQVVVSAKSLGSVPVMPMLAMVKLALPVLFRVMVCAALVVPCG
jgi:hypothetical protein